MEFKYFECRCGSAEHVLRFCLDDEDLYTEVLLRPKSPIERIWLALKYILGFKSKYGYYDCTLIRPEDYDNFIALFNEAKEKHNNAKTISKETN